MVVVNTGTMQMCVVKIHPIIVAICLKVAYYEGVLYTA